MHPGIWTLGKVEAGDSPDQSKQLPFQGGLPGTAHLPQDPEMPALILLVAAPRQGVSSAEAAQSHPGQLFCISRKRLLQSESKGQGCVASGESSSWICWSV